MGVHVGGNACGNACAKQLGNFVEIWNCKVNVHGNDGFFGDEFGFNLKWESM